MGKKKFLYEFSAILFENLNEIKPNILSETILALGSLSKKLNYNEYIPPPDILILELSFLLKNRDKFISRNLSKCIWVILNRNFVFLPKYEWANVCLRLIKVLNTFDLLTKKYCICSVYKIGKIVGPIKIMTIRNFIIIIL